MNILLDCDGVLSDCAGPVWNFAQGLAERELPPPSEWHVEFPACWEFSDEETRLFGQYILKSDVCWQIRLYPGVEDTIRKLTLRHQVIIVTSHWKDYPDWVPARDKLLAPLNVPVIYTHDKQLIHGDFLCDDKLTTLEHIDRPWEGVCFDRPWNQKYKGKRIHKLEELLSL